MYLFIAALAFATSAAHAELKVTHSRGDTRVDPKTHEVETAERGLAIVKLDDGSLLKLKGGTQVRVESSNAGTTVTLDKGGVLAKVKSVTAGKHFHIRTQSVVMGVRGTEFFASVHGQGDAWMCVQEGSVEITSHQKSILVPAGQGVFVKKSAAPSAPREYAWTKKLNWNFDAASGEVEDGIEPSKIYPDLKRINYD